MSGERTKYRLAHGSSLMLIAHRYNPASTWLSGVNFLNFRLWVWARSSLKVIGCCW